MKTNITKEQWQSIYDRLNKVSPIDCDCGTLCGAACCTCGSECDEEDLGMYLLPGEHLIHERPENPEDDWLNWSVDMAEDYDFPDSWKGPVFFVNCKTPPHCRREMRPMQCRTFPVKPYLTEDGVLQLLPFYEELPYSCPLIDREMKLNDDFLDVTYEVWRELIQDPQIYDLVMLDSEYLREAESEDL